MMPDPDAGRALLQTPAEITALATAISTGDAGSIKDTLDVPGTGNVLLRCKRVLPALSQVSYKHRVT